MWLPTLGHVLRLHAKLIERTGGLAGVRDRGLIESALMRANAAYGGYEHYKTIEEKAAAVCHGLIVNHGFVDGNKRIGIAVMLLILSQNSVPLSHTQSELVKLGLTIAQGMSDTGSIAKWIREHIKG